MIIGHEGVTEFYGRLWRARFAGAELSDEMRAAMEPFLGRWVSLEFHTDSFRPSCLAKARVDYAVYMGNFFLGDFAVEEGDPPAMAHDYHCQIRLHSEDQDGAVTAVLGAGGFPWDGLEEALATTLPTGSMLSAVRGDATVWGDQPHHGSFRREAITWDSLTYRSVAIMADRGVGAGVRCMKLPSDLHAADPLQRFVRHLCMADPSCEPRVVTIR